MQSTKKAILRHVPLVRKSRRSRFAKWPQGSRARGRVHVCFLNFKPTAYHYGGNKESRDVRKALLTIREIGVVRWQTLEIKPDREGDLSCFGWGCSGRDTNSVLALAHTILALSMLSKPATKQLEQPGLNRLRAALGNIPVMYKRYADKTERRMAEILATMSRVKGRNVVDLSAMQPYLDEDDEDEKPDGEPQQLGIYVVP